MQKVLSYILFVTLATVSAAGRDIVFSHIGLDDGLSQSTVLDIVQDSDGYLWVATYDGLNRYDGYGFTIFQHDDADSTSIGADIVHALVTDSRGRLWAGTGAGLSMYDADKEIFRNYRGASPQPVTDIVQLDSCRLLVTLGNVPAVFDMTAGRFDRELLPGALSRLKPVSMARSDDDVYVGTPRGLYRYHPADGTVAAVMPDVLGGRHVRAVLCESPARLWAGTDGDGLYRIDLATGAVAHYTAADSTLSSDYVRALALDADGRLWAGTINSLNVYDPTRGRFDIYGSNLVDGGCLSQKSVRSLYRDTQGGMWVGTFYGGLNYFHPLKERFVNIRSMPGVNSLNNSIVNCIIEDTHGNLWIGTNSGGLNRRDHLTGLYTAYTVADGLGSDDVKAVYADDASGRVYIGSHAGGLSVLDMRSGRITPLHNQAAQSVAARSIYSILPSADGSLLLGTLDGIMRYDPARGTFARILRQTGGGMLDCQRIMTAMRDSQGRLWYGTGHGVKVYDERADGLQRSSVLPKGTDLDVTAANCIHESAGGVYWVGTRAGLYRYDSRSRELTRYTTADGLPNNVVHAILEDSAGSLWVSTDRGLAVLKPDTRDFRIFTAADGLQSNQFSSAALRTRDGRMYFGGVNGISTFTPELMLDNPYAPSARITGLRIFNTKVRPDDTHGVLTRQIGRTDRITLSAAQSAFSLDFTVPNFIAGNHNTFAYMLDGYDKDWCRTSSSRSVSYSNLPPGTYRFMVKAANNDGLWQQTPTELEICILPVWYKTWWATLLWILLVAVAVAGIVRYFWMRKNMATQLQIERMDKQHQVEVNEMKLRFFINISHELRTPLTLIMGPLEELSEHVVDDRARRHLRNIGHNVKRLLNLVNQLMDFRRAELGIFKLQVCPTNVGAVVERIFQLYADASRRSGIVYNLVCDTGDTPVLCDGKYVELILNNLISNAFKYTPPHHSITVTAKTDGTELLLRVSDTGSGIPAAERGRIFDRFYQASQAHAGSGIGLSIVHRLVELHHGRIELDSVEGCGSTFSVWLPALPSEYNPEEICSTALPESPSGQILPLYVDGGMPGADADSGADAVEAETVLVVEDNDEIRRYLCDTLSPCYRVLEAPDGAAALSMLATREVGLVLTDVMMPVKDGIELCRSIKQNLATCHIPVIILSGKSEVDEQLEGLRAGADDYVAKPFSPAVLITKIRNIFRTHRHAINHYMKSPVVEPGQIALNTLDEQMLTKAKEIVERHLDDPGFSTEEFAREMCMSRSSLHLKMKAVTGGSTFDFIRKVRLSRACTLLRDGRYNISEISAMTGFSSPSYFATTFRKYIGCIPSEYGRGDLGRRQDV